MNSYRWDLKDGSKAELSFSPNFDNLIRKYKDNEVVESVFLMDCGIVSVMPFIMRYCFEENINLREREFLRNLKYDGFYEIDECRIISDFQRPLRSDAGTIRSVDGDLIMYSMPSYHCMGAISFDSKDISELVEGILKVLDCEGVPVARIKCIQTVQYYHRCLDNGLLE